MSGINNLENTFGARFKEYCEDRNLLVKKVNGAFQVPSISALNDCKDTIESHQQEMDMALCRLQNRFIKESHTELSIDKELLLNQTRSNRKRPHSCEAQRDPKKMKLQIYLRDSVQTIPTRLPEDMPGFIKLSNAKSGEDVFKTFQRYVMKEHRPACGSLAPQLCKVLELFRTQHRDFKSYSCLREILKKTQTNKKACHVDYLTRADIPAVHIEEIKTFLATVFTKVVPKELFGTVKNRRAIVSALFQFVTVPRSVRLNLSYYAKHLKIKSISWLKPINDETVKRSIFASMLLWFFRGYIDKLLHSQVIIVTCKDQRVFVRRWDWYRLQRHFLRKQREKKVLLDYSHERGWKPPKACYKLLPDLQYNAIVMRDTVKRVRPIISFRYSSKKERHDIYLIHTFLRQLYAFKFGTQTFQEQWRSVKREYDDEQIYIVSTDVRNAFGSIVLEKLFEFINLFTAELPDTLQLVEIGRRTRNLYQQDIISYQQFFSDLPLPFSSRTLFAHNKYIKPVNISKNWLLGIIEQFMFHQRVFIGNQIYLIGKGVLQGTKVSPVLSDIYYASILQTRVRKSLSPCKLIRYVDDVLFVSDYKTSANRFFDLTKKGITKYTCFFNKKTFTNLSSAPIEQYATRLGFLGMMIDNRNLELLPDFTEARQEYSPFKPNSLQNIQFINEKLRHPYSLKLPKIMLDSRINSVSTITRNVMNAFVSHGKYILDIVRRSFTETIKPETAMRLLRPLTIYPMKNLRRIIRYILEGDARPNQRSAEIWMKTILEIVLNSYEPVFRHIKSITQVSAVNQRRFLSRG